ncbi:MAG: zinc-dependent alcohol dehydrogenase [Acidimicrobiales bacterium]
MRAAVLHGVGDLRVEALPDPVPGPGEVLLGVESALTCGTDRKAYLRGHPRYLRAGGVLGHEYAGKILATGRGVTSVKEGDRVIAANSAPCGACFQCERERWSLCESLTYVFGGFAEALVVPAVVVEHNLHPLPETLPMEIAPIYEPLACALKAVRGLDPQASSQALVLGAGALGLLLTAALSRRGVEVTVLDPHPERLELAHGYGAKAVLAAKKGSSDVAAVRATINAGRGPELVIEAVGQPTAWALALEMSCAGGTVCLFGGCATGSSVELDTHRVHYEELGVRGCYHHDPPAVAEAIELLQDRSIPWHQLIGGEVGLDDLERVLTGELFPTALKVAVRA